jgi:hypothetical protein
MKKILHLLIVSSFLASCQKQPTASFTTNKETYNTGETIHCTDISNNAYSWTWTAPDGKIYTTRNLDWVTDSNDLGGTKTFTLEVTSKNGKKNSTSSKSVTVKELILLSDYFATDSNANYRILPITKSCEANNGNWVISASYSGIDVHGVMGGSYLNIYLSGITPPISSGTYTLQPNHTALTTGQASITIKSGDNDRGYKTYTSISGQINISITSNGKVQAVFSNIPTSLSYIFLSGDITCH